MDQWNIKHYVFASLLSEIWVKSVMDQWLKQTLCISYFTELILGTIDNGPVIKEDTLC